MYYFKRFLPAIFIILLLLFFPIRRILRENGFFIFGNKARKEALLWAQQDSIRVADSLKRIEIETNVVEEIHQDTLVKADKEEYPVFAGDIRNKYYIIIGSFTNPDNAKLAARKYRSLGYRTIIISTTNRNGIKAILVSINIFNNYNQAVIYLKEFQSKFDPKAWMYTNQ
jgi:hypothetical protein